MMCQDQLIVAGMGQIIGISTSAIRDTMDLYPWGIPDKWKCLQKVKAAFHHLHKDDNRKG